MRVCASERALRVRRNSVWGCAGQSERGREGQRDSLNYVRVK